jgi:GalNAc-alpha-(1->4)-GalNAc-alpha-(1->3)-diNAcBac-PP-undecaprenol alpha-1,4-N-acetyl-D-galactosaminyltransferase
MSNRKEDVNTRQRIAFVITSMAAGGAERVLSILAREFSARGYETALITLDVAEGDFYTLPPEVKRIGLNLVSISGSMFQAIANRAKRVWNLRRSIRKFQADVVISFTSQINLFTILACMGTGIPVIVSERTNPEGQHLRRTDLLLRPILYRLASALVLQTKAVSTWGRKWIRKDKIFVIPNPVSVASQEETRGARKKVVGAMGRLISSKGFDILVQAFAACSKEFPDWELHILGDGPERRNLEGMVEDLGIADQVQFLGIVADPMSQLCRMSLFVFSSRFEGFPNALIEAMACGLPVISTDCAYGPSEIVRPGLDGFLVPVDDVLCLGKMMKSLICDENLRTKMGHSSSQISTRYGVDAIMLQWISIIDTVVR